MAQTLLDLNPSLALIPSAYKAGKLYSLIPADGSGDFDVSRNGTATRVNKNGLIESVPANVPRFEFDPITGKFLGVLVEPAATNLFLRSEEFDNLYWVKDVGGVGITPVVTSNTSNSPKGEITADRVQMNLNGGTTTSDRSWITRTFSGTLPSSDTMTVSIYLKSNDNNNYNIYIQLTGSTPDDPVLVAITPEWQRFTLTRTRNNSTGILRFGLVGGLSLDVSNNADILYWGAQLETGSVATSYIPTTTDTVTRPADIISKTGIADLIGQTEGTIEVSFIYKGADDLFFIKPILNNISNYVGFFINTSNQLIARIRYFTTSNQTIDINGGVLTIGQKYKVRFVYKTGDSRLYVNNVLAESNSSTFLFSEQLDAVEIMTRAYHFNPSVRSKLIQYILFIKETLYL